MKKLTSILLALVLALALLPATVWAADEVAEVNGTKYETLEAAVAAVPNGGTVKLLKNATGGVVGTFRTPKAGQIQAKSFTIDFGGYTYTVKDPAVGSSTYESQGFHFEWSGDADYNHYVTLENGTINVAEDAATVKMLIQNYCNLILIDMTLDGTNLVESDVGYYTLSNCCGTVDIRSTTIIAHEDGVAFDVDGGYRTAYNKAPVHVTVEDDSNIVGKFEVTTGIAGMNPNNLFIMGGTFTMDPTPYVAGISEMTVVDGKYVVKLLPPRCTGRQRGLPGF